MAISVEALIRANLPLVAVPGVPAIRLHRAHPASGLRQLNQGQGGSDLASPYWAYPWPGGIGLARHILDHPDLVRNRRVLDLGSGSGLVAIAAAKAGAARCAAAEIDPQAGIAIRLNAEANDVSVHLVAEDLLDREAPAADIILVGDLFYESRFATRVTAFLDRCRAAGIDVLIGDVGRAYLPLARLRRLADYAVPEFGAPAGEASVRCGIFSFGTQAA